MIAIMRIGRLFDRCAKCGKVIRIDKPVLGGLHLCVIGYRLVIVDRRHCLITDGVTWYVADVTTREIVKSFRSEKRARASMRRLAGEAPSIA